MAARRGFQPNGDTTPVMSPAERLPFRSVQNQLLDQQLHLSAKKHMSSKPALKMKGEPVQVEELPYRSPLHGSPISVAPLADIGLTVENAVVMATAEDEAVRQNDCPDSLRAAVIGEEFAVQSRTSSSAAPAHSEHAGDVTSTELSDRAEKAADTVSAQDQWTSRGCLSDSLTSCVTQTATALEPCTDNRTGDVTFKSFLCTGIELEIADTSATTEETLLLLTGRAADVSSGCSFGNDLSDHLNFTQHVDLNSSDRHEDHAYCLAAREDSCSGNELLPDGSSVTEASEQQSPPDGQALEQSSVCLENMQNGVSSSLLQENSMWSSSTVGHHTAVQSLTADQSQNIAESSVTADQSQNIVESSVTADQSKNIAERSVTADQSLDSVKKSVTAVQSQNIAERSVTADQSQVTAGKSVGADQSKNIAERSVTADQSQNIAERSVTADQSLDTAERSLTADQLQNTTKSVTADQSQVTAGKSVGADQSQNTAEKSLTADQLQNPTEKSVATDQSQNTTEKSITADQSQVTAVQGLAAQCKGSPGLQTEVIVTPVHAQERHSEGTSCVSPSCVDTGSPELARSFWLKRAGRTFPWDAADSPVGPRETRLLMEILESPMPLPRLSSTLLHSILASGTVTPQTTKPKSNPNPPPAEAGPGPQPEPRASGPQPEPRASGPQPEPRASGPQPEPRASGPQPEPRASGPQPEPRASGPQPEPRASGPQPEPRASGPQPEPRASGPQPEPRASGPQPEPRASGPQPEPRASGPQPEPPAAAHTGLQQEVHRGLSGAQTGPPQDLGPQALGDLAGIQSGPLQVRLRQMADILFRASQSLVPAVECHSASTWTSPVPQASHSVNTSGVFEYKREFSVADASTSTDSLPWNLAPETVAAWSRQDLEQRLFSALIMLEAVSQQLALARAHRGHTPPPSDLRDRLVQTDHTELSQGVLYRELYVQSQERLRALEQGQEQQQRLLQELRSGSSTMTAVTLETEHALSSVNEMGKIASEDQVSISEQMCRMRALYGRFREALRRTEERMQRCMQEKLLMEQQREEALRSKEASVAVLEQLQARHAAQVSELETSVGSHLELLPALSNTYQQQVCLNEEYVESLQAADELLKETISDQSRIYEELSRAQFLLHRTKPVLLQLHQKAASALQAQKQQNHETNRMRDELEQTSSLLHAAQRNIGDLNLQITILTSEMAVLRQRLSEVEEERAQAKMKSTELSATLSSTQTFYTLLQQALTHRLEEEQEKSSRCVEELSGALAEREVQLTQAQRSVQELQAQLSSTCEMTEFLQMESEVSREQVMKSDALMKSHLQSLRERNLECEDLKRELCALRLERDDLQQEVLSTREKSRSLLLDMGRQLDLASTDIVLLHHRVYTLNSALNTALSAQNPDGCAKDSAPPSHSAPPRHSARSFVDSIMVAVTTEKPQSAESDEGLSAALGSGNSAFTRVPTGAPKKDEEEGSSVQELLSGLREAVSQLVCTVDRVRELRDGQCEALQHTVSRLQGELDSQAAVYRCEVSDLSGQVAHLQAQVEKDAVALQHKSQEERTMRKLCSDLDECRELYQQQKSENKELRRMVSELQCSAKQAQLEAKGLREELSVGQSAERLPALQEKLRLQEEVDRLRKSLSEAEDSRGKLLDRAKRHRVVLEANQTKLQKELQVLDQILQRVKETLSSIPEVVKDCEQLGALVAYLG